MEETEWCSCPNRRPPSPSPPSWPPPSLTVPDNKLSARTNEVSEPSGWSLAARLADGDERALEESYRLYGTIVRSYLRRFVGLEEADDLLQVVFLEVWRSREKIDPSRRLRRCVSGFVAAVFGKGVLDGVLQQLGQDDGQRRGHVGPDFADVTGDLNVDPVA